MFKAILIGLLAFWTINSAIAIEIIEQEEIIDTQYLQKALFSTYKKIAKCQAIGGSNKQCNCQYRRYFTYLNLLENEFYRKYSHLKGASELKYIEDKKTKLLMLGEYHRKIKFKYFCNKNLY